MRKIVVAQYISLDGVVEAPERWHFPYADEQMMGVLFATAATTETMLLGRRTFEVFAGTFAAAPEGDPVGDLMNRPRKLVPTRTLTELPWRNSEVLRGDLVPAVAELKRDEGGDILVNGSISVVRQLLRAGLVDELSLLVHPIVVGRGQRLFEDDGPTIPMALASCEVFATGASHQVYRPA